MKKYVVPFFILVTLFSCRKSSQFEIPKPSDIIGKWKLVEVYGNDSWGGPAYWRDVKTEGNVEFTTDGKYYRNTQSPDDMYLSGNYKKQKDSTILVIPFHPLNYNPSHPEASDYHLYYSLQKGGYLILWNGRFEGVLAEKYSLFK